MILFSIFILLLAMSLPSIKNQISPVLFSRISLLSLTFSAILSINMAYIQSIGSGLGLYTGLFQITIITQIIDTFLFLIASAILIISQFYMMNPLGAGAEAGAGADRYQTVIVKEEKSKEEVSEYSLIILFSVAGGSLLISSSDLVSMYLSIELQSFAVYILATIYKNSISSTSAGLKYFLLGGLSSCLILLGAGIIYTFTGLSNLESIYMLVSVSDSVSISQGFTVGLILILVGFLFKISAAPFHNWAPDVYDNVPTIVTTWLSIMPKISILIFLLELQALPMNGYWSNIGESIISTTSIIPDSLAIPLITGSIVKNLLLISSMLSLIIGSIVGLAQSRIKRLLTYSTISHVGFLLLALAINTEQSVESFIFYIIQYSITNLNLFLILLSFGYIFYTKPINNLPIAKIFYALDFFKGHSLLPLNTNGTAFKSLISGQAKNIELGQNKKDVENISELTGQFNLNPILGLTFAISLFSMAGVPPLIGFFGKQQVLYSATYSGYFFLSLVAIIVSVISASYYLKIIKVIHFDAIPVKLNDLVSSSHRTYSYGNILSIKESKNNTTFNSVNIEEVKIQNSPSFLIAVLTLINLFFILNPSLILNGIHLITLSLFYT